MSRLSRITSDPEICHGKAVVRGLRYPVDMLLELLASGMSEAEILADYPDLEPDDILAVLEYAAVVVALGPLTRRTFVPVAELNRTSAHLPPVDYTAWRADMDAMINHDVAIHR